MKIAGFISVHRLSVIFPLVLLFLFSCAASNAQTSVYVPGTAAGCFGNILGECYPLVSALTVTGPRTITITYDSGLVTWSPGVTTGPEGADCSVIPQCSRNQTPLSESIGIAPRPTMTHVAALMGIFVTQSRVQEKGFQAMDGTKNLATVGINPGGLFYVGTGKTITVTQAGTLFLGINDWWVNDNAGGFNVTVTGP